MKRVMIAMIIAMIAVMISSAAEGNMPPGAYFVLPGINHIEAVYKEWSGPYMVRVFNERGEEEALPFAVKAEGEMADIRIEGKGFFLKPLTVKDFKISVFLIHNDLSRSYGYPSLVTTQVTFTNLMEGQKNVIKIYNSIGELVRVLETNENKIIWDLLNESGRIVSWGIYIYLITSKDGGKKIGKIAVVR